ncbi:hypothetical protein C8T65DRAFT_724064 [Cerioporus squamosus]|nr:hypothetical protein C8T65DRAFT_724064 [Cerioporus squamosus]
MPNETWIGYTPDMWKTGDEPMTHPQTNYLWVMSNRTRVRIPFIAPSNPNGQNITKAEASTLLTKFENGEHVDESFINGLGRGQAGSEPGHPLTWSCCHDQPTSFQTRWIVQLSWELGIPAGVTQKATLGITLGQASWLIKLLRTERGATLWRQQSAKWLESAVTASIEEVPLPDEGEGVDCEYDPDAEMEGEESDDDDDDDEMDVEIDGSELRELLADSEL